MSEYAPLNRWLYKRLRNRFGDVEIANERVAMQSRQKFDPILGRKRLDISTPGEYYRVNCPYCNDTRKRLWVSHMYGMPEPWNDRRVMNYLAVCYNEECLQEWENREDLEELIFEHINRNARRTIVIEQGEIVEESGPMEEVDVPGNMIPVNELDSDDEAVVWLRGRRFRDMDYLAKEFGISVCVRADNRWPLMQDRLYIPIEMNGIRVGWQGRCAFDCDWKVRRIPKYYGKPRMPKRRMIYNWDRVKRSRLLVLVEGAPSVWWVSKECTGAVLGKTIPPGQMNLIRQWAALHEYDCALVLMLDPNAQDNVEGLMPELLSATRGRCCNVLLPEGKDPQDLNIEYVWELMDTSAAKAGIDLEGYLT